MTLFFNIYIKIYLKQIIYKHFILFNILQNIKICNIYAKIKYIT